MMCRNMCAAWLDSARDVIFRHRRIINLRNANAPAAFVLCSEPPGKIGATPHAPPSPARTFEKSFLAVRNIGWLRW